MAGAAPFLWQGGQGWAQGWPSPFHPCTPKIKCTTETSQLSVTQEKQFPF